MQHAQEPNERYTLTLPFNPSRVYSKQLKQLRRDLMARSMSAVGSAALLPLPASLVFSEHGLWPRALWASVSVVLIASLGRHMGGIANNRLKSRIYRSRRATAEQSEMKELLARLERKQPINVIR